MESLEELEAEFTGKRILVTGHTGFKGSWLLAILKSFDANVMGYALAPESNGLYQQINGDELCDSVIGNILDRERMTTTIAEFAPEYLIHLAAQPLVLESYNHPILTFETNAIGTANVLMPLLKSGTNCAVVIVTTDKVYENNEGHQSFSETMPLGGDDPYSASKACTEIITNSLRTSFFCKTAHRIATARAGNVIGGGDWSKNRLIPDIAKAFYKQEPVVLRHPEAVRPWQHVLDPLFGYLMLIKRLKSGAPELESAFNFGPSDSRHYTVGEVAQMCQKSWGSGQIKIEKNTDNPKEASFLKLNSSKAKQTLGWESVLTVEQAIDWTIKWYKNYYEKPSNAFHLMLDQVNDYKKMLNNSSHLKR